MRKAGCVLPPMKQFIKCATCEGDLTGGYLNTDCSITLCENRLEDIRGDQRALNTTLAHELIHAYDHCVSKVHWHDLRHHACSEIRAANLSGDCDFRNELDRGHFKIAKQQPECVRRRAVLSVSANPNCSGADEAKRVVDEVFEACYNDTAPYDHAP